MTCSETGWGFMLQAHGLRRSDVRVLNIFQLSDHEACSLLITNNVRGKIIKETAQAYEIPRRDAVRKIARGLVRR